jgi:hypothetical protein
MVTVLWILAALYVTGLLAEAVALRLYLRRLDPPQSQGDAPDRS